VVTVVALLATTANDAVVVANRQAFGQAFPMRGPDSPQRSSETVQ
jgi:hypothetical protein